MNKIRLTINPTDQELKLAGDILEYGIDQVPCCDIKSHLNVRRRYCMYQECRKMFLAQCFANYRIWLHGEGCVKDVK